MRAACLFILLAALGGGNHARAEAGPAGGEKKILPLLEDPSALLDEDPVIPPNSAPPEPFRPDTTPPKDLGKSIKIPASLPAASPVPPATAAKEAKPLVPVKRTESATGVTLPDAKTPISASPVSLPAATVGDAAKAVDPTKAPADKKDKVVETKIMMQEPAPVQGPELAVVLADGRFRPARLRLKQGEATRILFTTLGRKPAALIIERLRVQRWLSRPEEAALRSPASSGPWELNREVNSNRLTEIVLDPVKGTYSFHDAISGATGEIIVE